MSAPDQIMVSACGKAIVTDQTAFPDDVEYIRADLMPQWKPIDSAPNDRIKFLSLNHDGNIHTAIMCRELTGSHAFSLTSGSYLSATHWMPLPTPPTT